MRHSALREENRRLLVSVGVALLLHLALGAVILALPEKKTSRADRRTSLRVTLSAPAVGAGQREDDLSETPAERAASPPEAAPVEAPAEVATTDAHALQATPPEQREVETPVTRAPPSEMPTNEAAPPEEPAGEEVVQTPPIDGVAPTPATEDERAAGAAPSTDEQDSPATEGPIPSAARTAELPTGAGLAGQRASGTGDDGPTGESLPTLEPVRYVAPEYPEAARRAGWSGTVTVAITIGRRGRVDGVDLIESSGYDALDQAAVRAVRLWRFPRERNGEESLHRFDFRLE